MYSTGKVCVILTLFACIHGYGGGEQDWGWFEVREGTHMFYWLYRTTAKWNSSAPLVLWLQGGPGISSTGLGNFGEIGLLHINGTPREHAWTKYVNVLFVDSPVGCGYSYVENIRYLAKTMKEVGTDMVNFLDQFYKLYPEMTKSKLYIFGESYGGKMALEIAKQVHIKASVLKIVEGGVGLIDSWVCPIKSVFGWSPFLLRTGFIDNRAYKRIMNMTESLNKLVATNQYDRAALMREQVETEIQADTNGINFQNILSKVSPYHEGAGNSLLAPPPGSPEDLKLKITELMETRVRQFLKIPESIPFKFNSVPVLNALFEDNMKSAVDNVEYLLNNTLFKVAVINGQLDLGIGTYSTLEWIDGLNTRFSDTWKSAERKPIVINNVIEGYVTQTGRLSYYAVNRAGQMVPVDNPQTAIEILRRVTNFDEKQ